MASLALPVEVVELGDPCGLMLMLLQVGVTCMLKVALVVEIPVPNIQVIKVVAGVGEEYAPGVCSTQARL